MKKKLFLQYKLSRLVEEAETSGVVTFDINSDDINEIKFVKILHMKGFIFQYQTHSLLIYLL